MYREPSMPRVSRDTTIDWYYVDNKSNIAGPLKLSELRKSLIEGKYDSQVYIWCEEFLDWTQIFQLQNGASLLDPDFL
jgi:GYF domain 2